MMRHIDHRQMGRSQIGWLDSYFHFSFAEYYNPKNIQFGALRVINDDMIQPNTGFDPHPHRDMEIITYVIDGELTHADSMKNRRTLTRGQVQYMSAGTGVVHSEHNFGKSLLRLLQIWIFPDSTGLTPNYGDYQFTMEDRDGRWLPIATWVENTASGAPVRIHQDINMYATVLSPDQSLDFEVAKGRQAYFVLIEGSALFGDKTLAARDALEAAEETVTVTARDTAAHILVIEMRKA